MPPQDMKDTLLPTVISLSDDPIPNIRFNVAKSLETLRPILDRDPSLKEAIDTTVKPALEKLSKDKDQDVQFFAARALQEKMTDITNEAKL